MFAMPKMHVWVHDQSSGEDKKEVQKFKILDVIIEELSG